MRKDATGNSGTTFCPPAVRERPILFSGEMVRAILDGRKTQTRRIIKPQPEHGLMPCHYNKTGWAECTAPNEHGITGCRCNDVKAPFGCGGDEYEPMRLWVRETWKTGCNLDKYSPKQIREKFEDAGYRLGDRGNGKCCPMLYLANGEHKRWGDYDIADFGEWGKTRVSIHMPRWASRITLEITDVRVERLQDISEADAISEGVNLRGPVGNIVEAMKSPGVYQFANLWEAINGAGAWDANPWVWVVKFRPV